MKKLASVVLASAMAVVPFAAGLARRLRRASMKRPRRALAAL
ncbi:MAG: hypothetical protein ACLS7Z_01070 [Christensenellales bacterium]